MMGRERENKLTLLLWGRGDLIKRGEKMNGWPAKDKGKMKQEKL
jgi:hypothetical protein